MNLLANIEAITAGGRNSRLLQNTRLQSGGTEAYGDEAIVAAFRRSPFLLDDGRRVVETPNNIAIFTADEALFADVQDDHITRLWRTRSIPAASPEEGLSVPFDADLAQARADVFARLEDHPELDAAAVEPLLNAGRSILDEDTDDPLFRVRAFLIRAFSAQSATAALFAVHVLTGDQQRASGFLLAAVHLKNGTAISCWDPKEIVRIRQRRWMPRLVA